jgi:hypothetical protein
VKVRSISGGTIIAAIVVMVILWKLPAAIERLLETGDFYFFTGRFFEDILARLSGPGRLRFIFQPIVAILLGVRDGVKDARSGVPPFLWALAFHGSHRMALLKDAAIGIRNIVAVAILLDLISQALIFGEIRPAAALVVGPVLIAVPYVSARGVSNRIARAIHPHVPIAKRG